MDIYKYAKEFDADYYDYNTGYIYKVQNYNRCLKFGLPTPGIEVVDQFGNTIGYAKQIEKHSDGC